MNFFGKIWQFIREAKSELKKVTWPTKKDTTRYTLIVIGVSLGVALFLGLCDFIFSWLLNKFIL
ncbi:MAG: preprotein translocase subunit SecE [Candidatus Portnoybacteria bacterium CG10_big_fil_rev_8_21_14_0_10_44_7]|uniref:Protein translocase subunit SecE n=1 Tax=Candidatus Portnoybacteria bacterium CG10_big_fil_rev_8_21_14_0_10_44_7 TaxID=1974816 RepID=A0A2M8KIX4_9BACT|nr:MAG: preprotein translocase subunit SecE [Candidatus Portnoybacteria bacterium CG10_big_fil_rev_8_21_14_0_10_44_7]